MLLLALQLINVDYWKDVCFPEAAIALVAARLAWMRIGREMRLPFPNSIVSGACPQMRELAPGERWYVARTLPRREAGAYVQLCALKDFMCSCLRCDRSLDCYRDETGICRFDRDLEEGQAIRVIAGPLAEAVGKLVRLDANGRVRVLLQIMGGQVHASLERSFVEVV